MMLVKAASRTALATAAAPARLAQWAARNIAYVTDDLASTEARVAAAEAFTKNEPLPYQKLKEEYRDARLASIRYRLLYNPLDIAAPQVVYNYKWIVYVIIAFLVGRMFGELSYPSGIPIFGPPNRASFVTIPFDAEEKYKLLENRPGGYHEH